MEEDLDELIEETQKAGFDWALAYDNGEYIAVLGKAPADSVLDMISYSQTSLGQTPIEALRNAMIQAGVRQ